MTRRLVTSTVFALLLLSACRKAGHFTSTEVLQKTTAASAALQSVAYDVQIAVSAIKGSMKINGTGELHGILNHGGQQTALSFTVHGTLEQGKEHTTVDLSADTVSDDHATYALLHTLKLDPPNPLFKDSASMMEKWWKIDRSDAMLPSQPITPDPVFLRAEAAVVRVEQDHGIETINGRDAYHYTVSLDIDRLVALLKEQAEQKGRPFDAKKVRSDLEQYDAVGELWIDAETFVMHKLSWAITAKGHPEALSLLITIALSKHDAAPAVTIPTTFELFHPETIFQQLVLPSGTLPF